MTMATILLTITLLFTIAHSQPQQELSLLLQAKSLLTTPTTLSWSSHSTTPCTNFTGITCNSLHSITSIDLSNYNLSGPFPSPLCLLPSLTTLLLPLNYLTTPQNLSLTTSLSKCTHLTHLDLSQNYLTGPLPDLHLLPSLLHLDLSGNNFSGQIPATYGLFPRLETLSLVGNLLSGEIPSFLSDLTSLRHLNLSYNPFAPANLPREVGRMKNLEVLWAAGCNLVGELPAEIGGLQKLTDLDVSDNMLSGQIPDSVANLSSALQIELYNNSFSGRFPDGFGKLVNLLRVDASMNRLSGELPVDLFDGPSLESVHLYSNELVGTVPEGISKSRSLADVRLFQNRLSGGLPDDFGLNSPLVVVDFSDNLISGEIPRGLCGNGKLEELLLLGNQFSGRIPEELGACKSLERVRLNGNRLSGDVPAGIWGLPHVYLLELSDNLLTGSLSKGISNAGNLSKLLIDNNLISGTVPSEIGSLSKLYEFSAANNRLSGPLPASIGKLSELGQLDLHNNSLSGELPREIKSMSRLNELNLSDNGFTGSIPAELGSLQVLNYLDLSGNKLSGEIPIELENIKLIVFNFSDNLLSGPLPPLYAGEAYRSSFLGNPGLCKDTPDLCRSPGSEARARSRFAWLLRSIFVITVLVLVIGVAWFYCRYRKFKDVKLGADRSKWTLTSFHKLGFSEYEILDCLGDEDNVLGSGASGKVYKAVLSNGETVAVKKLWGTAKRGDNEPVDDGFDAEVVTLGKIRHKNIVKLWCCCTHKDYKLLVYEYMPNGSLGDFLRSSKAALLDWPTRYKIALDAAEGLSYLHHDCVPSIVHRDVKSNNILLDAEFGARVADFGVAKVVDMIGKRPKSMSVIAGSCGYIAPEYAYTLRVNEKSDIYSFGVVILELVTGKPPNDPEFGEKDLVKWVFSVIEQKGVDHVIDPNLDAKYKEQTNKVLSIGLLCTSPLPINRPSMRRVVKMLQEVVGSENKLNVEKRDGKLTPYYYEDPENNADAV